MNMAMGLRLLVALVASFVSLHSATPYIETPGEGEALVEELLTRIPPDDSEILGLLKIRPSDGPLVEIPIRMTIRLSSNSWHDVYQTQPVNGKPGEVLIVQHRARDQNRYLHGTVEQASSEPALKPLDPAHLYQPFAGSDFFPADLGLEFLHWPSQKIVKKEMRKSRSCRVVESTNPNPIPNGYAKVLSWIDFETGNIIMAEGYDTAGQKLKEFSIRKVSRSEGKLKSVEIRNDQTDSRTLLELNVEIAER
jgi:hypothetical protein